MARNHDRDFLAALSVFLVVVAATFPTVLPSCSEGRG